MYLHVHTHIHIHTYAYFKLQKDRYSAKRLYVPMYLCTILPKIERFIRKKINFNENRKAAYKKITINKMKKVKPILKCVDTLSPFQYLQQVLLNA